VKDWVDKAKVLIEALPYMRRWVDRTIVIKYGGHAMTDEKLRRSFAVDVVLLKQIGVRPVIVHGGGPQIAEILDRFGAETMEVVEMVLGGRINHEIVELIHQGGGRAIGVTGSDGGLLRVRQKRPDGQDIGRVGEVVAVDPQVLRAVTEAGFIPVVAPIGADDQGLTYNVNADEAAGAVARALGAEKLILLTDVEGVKDRDGTLVSELSVSEARRLIEAGTIRDGMIPKVECCIETMGGGVERTHIIDGRMLHAVLLEIFTDRGVGTLLTP